VTFNLRVDLLLFVKQFVLHALAY